MRTQLATKLREKRGGLLAFTCWAVWLVVTPTILFSLLYLTRPSFLDGVTDVNLMLPLPVGLAPLGLVLISSIGLWRQEVWGVLVYAIAGLLGATIMIFHPDAGEFITNGFASVMFWVTVAIGVLVYSVMLWKQLPAAND